MSESTDRWLLPAGIQETLPPQAMRIERLRRRLIDLFTSWGYDLVMPPFIEYLESLLVGAGPDLDLRTFKLIDQLSGRMMGVRADMTPQVARMDRYALNCEGPNRLCYLGTVLHTTSEGPSSHRSPIQLGAELFGHTGPESDVEIISLMLESLMQAGITDVHLDVGHVGIFRGLAKAACLSETLDSELFEALQRKSRFDMQRLLESYDGHACWKEMLLALVELRGDEQTLSRARDVLALAPASVVACVRRLQDIAELLRIRCPHAQINFDLAELRGYHYEQGVVFAAFVARRGQEIARGGRYGGVQADAGGRSAVGFSTDLRLLNSLGSDCESKTRGGIRAPAVIDAALVRVVAELRHAGERVIWDLPDDQSAYEPVGCDRVLVQDGDQWLVESISG